MTNDSAITPEERLANARRISADNADIAVKALGMLGDCQRVLSDLMDALSKAREYRLSHADLGEDVLLFDTVAMLTDPERAARDLIEKQKHEKPY